MDENNLRNFHLGSDTLWVMDQNSLMLGVHRTVATVACSRLFILVVTWHYFIVTFKGSMI